MGKGGTGVIETSSAARIRAFGHFLREGEPDDRLRWQGNSRTDEITAETHIVIFVMMSWAAFSDFLVFLLTCKGLASATVCTGSAWRVSIRCPISSKAQMQALAYVECVGC